jgi:hypothetical protein
MDDSDAYRLEHDKKVTFFDCHQRFLLLSHPFRGDRKSFTKGKTVRKWSSKQKLGADITQMLDDIKESGNGKFEVMVRITTGLIKVVFGNSLMQRHLYYPTTSI